MKERRYRLGPLAIALAACLTPAGCAGAAVAPSLGLEAETKVLVGDAGDAPTDMPLYGPFIFSEHFEAGAERWKLSGGWRAEDGAAWLASGCAGGELAPDGPLDWTYVDRPYVSYRVQGTEMPPEALGFQLEARRPDGAWTPVGTPALARFSEPTVRVADMRAWAGGYVELRFRALCAPASEPGDGLRLDDIHVIDALLAN